MGIEEGFDVGFVARLASEEKQIQQSYRPVIGVHKWFARRPGSLFRALVLAEFAHGDPLREAYFRSHDLRGITVLDPFMGGGTTLLETNRVGGNVVGVDVNPMAHWVVRQELAPLERGAFRRAADAVVRDVERAIGPLYETTCTTCARAATVKYFLWVKQVRCRGCAERVDLFPGYRVATNERHPRYVLYCPSCRSLPELDALPPGEVQCPTCAARFAWARGPARRNRYRCPCGREGRYPADVRADGPPAHRPFALEYHCATCRRAHAGRFFKPVDATDLRRLARARRMLRGAGLPCPADEIPDGDETRRLHRWGYRRYRDMFNQRQLLALGLLVQAIRRVPERETRHALATVFSDTLRYQNMLARYDTYALKCQDIFSVHGFPVGLVQCENNPLGIPGVGSGGFRHFVEKYDRAKAYCEQPFETVTAGGARRRSVRTSGERIAAAFVSRPADVRAGRRALLHCGSVHDLTLGRGTVDAVFTDPPYFDNVQYAELMDFCFAWLRLLLGDEVAEFAPTSTRSADELTGNATSGRDLAHFTEGLAHVFSAAARALKRGAPFVFTYHRNDLRAYVPIVVGVLDAGLICTATLPCPAEMTASLHINGTASSVMDSIMVCRRAPREVRVRRLDRHALSQLLSADEARLREGDVSCTRGDFNCLALGHLARYAIAALRPSWRGSATTAAKMAAARAALERLVEVCRLDEVMEGLTGRAECATRTR